MRVENTASRRTCHAGQWVGSLPSCAPFEFCPGVPRIQNGYLATPRESDYRLHSIVKGSVSSVGWATVWRIFSQ